MFKWLRRRKHFILPKREADWQIILSKEGKEKVKMVVGKDLYMKMEGEELVLSRRRSS